MLRGLTTIAFHTTDLEAAKRWYTELRVSSHTSTGPSMQSFASATTSTSWACSTIDPFGNILGIMHNPHYLDVLGSTRGA
ncbi:MAG: VOC family protein [Pseudonocardiaceae bacterium]